MFRELHPVLQALVGGLLTWGMTALGAAAVFVLKPKSKRLMDASFGFAAGVMLAAAFWSLLTPAIDIAEGQVYGRLAFLPVAGGFIIGAAFVSISDVLMTKLGFDNMVMFFKVDEEMEDESENNGSSGKRSTTASTAKILDKYK